MKDNELQFDRKSHVLYSKPCKKEIQAKIAMHYPKAERETVWEQVQRQYVDFLSDWRTDLGGKKNFHNGVGGTYDCIAIMSYYVVTSPSRSIWAANTFQSRAYFWSVALDRSSSRKKFRNCSIMEWVMTVCFSGMVVPPKM